MSQVKEVMVSVSTPELDPQTLSPKIAEKSPNLPDETTTAGNESEISTPPYPKKVPESSAPTPSDYETKKMANITAFREKCKKELTIDKLKDCLSKREDAADAAKYGLEKAPPRVVREIPLLSVTTRQSAHNPKMVGSLDNLEEKGALAKLAKLAELDEKNQAKAKKLEQSSSRNPLEKLCAQDSVFGLFEKSPQMGMQNNQIGRTPDQANKSFDSVSSMSTPSGTKTKIDESILTDDFSFESDASSETESPPKKAKKNPKKPENKQLSPWHKDENGMPVKAVKLPENAKSTAKKTTAKKTATKTATKTAKTTANKNTNKKPVKCYKCESVFMANANLKLHFNRCHTKEKFDVSKVEHIKFMCYNCPEEFETYSLLEKHFAQKYDTKVLNPKKVYLGDSMKRASVLLKLNLGAPPPSIKKNLPKVKKLATPKTKVSLKKTLKVHKFTCYACNYTHSDKENLVQHIIDIHEDKENMDGKYILQVFLAFLFIVKFTDFVLSLDKQFSNVPF